LLTAKDVLAELPKITYAGSPGGLRVPLIVSLLGYAEIIVCMDALCVLVARKQWKDYWALGSFLAVRLVANVSLYVIHYSIHGLGRHTGYQAYFYVYWMAYAIQSVLAMFIVYGIFRLTLAPLKGLLKFGTVLFCVIVGLSALLALGSTFAPHVTGVRYLIGGISQLERSQSLLTLCMLAFVFVVMRSAGISVGSKIFGVGLGMGVLAMNDLVQSAWLTFDPDMGRAYTLINCVVICAIPVLWTAYFALPEPERGEIDAHSPLMRWNIACLTLYGM
jgi:hypothetical protein